MKQKILLALGMLFAITIQAQTSYTLSYNANSGNPGGLNTGNDDDLTGWSVIISPSINSNQWSSAVSIPFAFTYFGHSVTELKASANGLITFSTTTSVIPADNNNLPSALLPDSTIACFWDAFTSAPPTGSNDNVSYQVFGTSPNRQLWVKWSSYEMGVGPVSYTNIACVLEETTDKIYLVEGYTPGTPLQTTTAGLQLNATTAIQAENKNRPQTLNTSNGTADNDYFTFTPYVQSNMLYMSTTSDQPILTKIASNTQNEGILRVAVSTSGELNPLAVTQLNFSTLGTTLAADITNAKAFYTGNSDVLNTTTQFGSTVSSPTGTFNIIGNQVLKPGVNYFWLTYSISASAAAFNQIDAEFNQLTVASTTQFPTISAPVGYREVSTGLSGTITVGTGSTYTHLSDAFKAINELGLSGNIVLSITSDITDTANAILTYQSPSPYAIKIVPSADILRNIKGSFTNSFIELNGSKHVTIDGRGPVSGTGKYLRFLNISDFGPTITFTNGAQLDTIQHAIIEGTVSQQDKGVITLAPSAASNTGVKNVFIFNNDIRDRSDSIGIPTLLFYAEGAPNLLNGFVTISNNNLFNFRRSGVFVSPTGNDGNWKISNNHFYYNASTNPAGGDIVPIMLIPGNAADNNEISGNFIGGQAQNCGGAAWSSTNGVNWVAMNINSGIEGGTSVQGNTIQNINISTASSIDFVGIRIESGRALVGNLIGNTIGHQANPNSIVNSSRLTLCIYGFTSSLGEVIIANNTIANIAGTGTATSAGVRGICMQGGASSANIYNNYIFNLSSTATNTSALTSAIMGIGLNSGAMVYPCIVKNNIISNLSTSAPTNNVIPTGIVIDNGSENGVIEGNIIYNITNVSTGATASIHGIYVAGGVNNWTIKNNMVTLTNGTNTNATTIRGISDNASGNVANYINNSVYIGGSTAGAANSFAFERRNANGIPMLRNNILYNNRTGTGVHAAIANVPSTPATNWDANTSGYNLLVAAKSSSIGAWGSTFTPLSFDQLQSTSGGDQTSWSDTANNVPSSDLFRNLATGNLSLDTSNNKCWYAAGKGIALAGNNLDYNGNPRSTTIADGAVDIGADQIPMNNATRASLLIAPPNTIVTGNITATDSSIFTFAGRTIAKVYWNTGVLPASINLRYYTGVNPPASSTQKYFNSYCQFLPTGAGTFDADVKLYYDSALFGTVTNAASIQMADYNTSWTNYASTIINTVEQSYRVNTIGNLNLFTGTDISNPLPVKLLSFNGNKIAKDANLFWQSASELNTNAYLLERSFDGNSFETIGKVKALNKGAKYTFTDNGAFEHRNVAYYRLKMVDNDGSFEYSPIIVLQSNTRNTLAANVYPNPYTNETSLSFTSEVEQVATLTVSDIQGRTVWSNTINTQVGVNSMPLALENMNHGIYFIRLEIAGDTYQSKLIK
jgi:hypothetical protein